MSARRALGRATRLGLGMAAAGAAWAATSGGAVASPLPVDLRNLPQEPLLLTGQGTNEYVGTTFGMPTGRSIETRCDLDGDGVDDLVASGAGWTPGGGNGGHHGRLHVIRGRAGWVGGILPAIPEAITITGYEEGNQLGEDVVCAGDVDGDGIDDLAVGMGGSGTIGSGIQAYVVYGAANLFAAGSFTVDAAPGRLVAIKGANVKPGSVPTQWAPLGDLDGDGHDDLALSTGSAGIWVVPGRPRADVAGDTIDVAQPGGGYLAAEGITYDYDAIEAVGDVDGDGVGDIAVGQYGSDGAGPVESGVVQMVSGAALDDPEAEPFDVATELAGEKVLFRIQGPAEYSRAGSAIASLGDIDGDGLDDVAVGMPGSPYGGEPEQVGQVFVLYGRTSHDQVNLPDLGAAGGYSIVGLPGGADFGSVVETAGDVNGDGIVDLLIGAAGFTNSALPVSARYVNGAAYVVYGQAGSEPIDVADPTPATGAVLRGQHHYSRIGDNLASIADLDGNGLPELIVGGQPRGFPGKGELTILRLGEPLPKPPGPDPDPGPPRPDSQPEPGPRPDTAARGLDKPQTKAKPKRVTGEVTRTGRRGSVRVTLSKRLGAKPRKTYRVKLLRKGKTVARGKLRGRTLKLSLREVGRGKRARYPRLRGAYTLTGGRRVKRTRIRIG